MLLSGSEKRCYCHEKEPLGSSIDSYNAFLVCDMSRGRKPSWPVDLNGILSVLVVWILLGFLHHWCSRRYQPDCYRRAGFAQ